VNVGGAAALGVGRRDALIVRIHCAGKKHIERREAPLPLSGHMLGIHFLVSARSLCNAGRSTSARTSSGTFAFGGKSRLSRLKVANRMGAAVFRPLSSSVH
jgi:hypothetical protein